MVMLRRWCFPGGSCGLLKGTDIIGIPRRRSALTRVMVSMRSSCWGVMASGKAAATRNEGERFRYSSPHERVCGLLDEYASDACFKRLLKSKSVPIPSMMLCGARRTRCRRIVLGSSSSLTASDVLSTNNVGSFGTGGSELHHSRPVCCVATGQNVSFSNPSSLVLALESFTFS